MLLGPGSLSLWSERRLPWALALSWVCFTTAGLIKVIPLLWLGLPLLMVQLSSNPQSQAPLQTLPGRMLRLLGRPGFWLYIGTSLMAIAGWYWHAHQLGQASGLSFGFWGSRPIAAASVFCWTSTAGSTCCCG